MAKLFSAILAVFAFVVVCGLGVLQKSHGIEVSLEMIVLRATLAAVGFLLLGWVIGVAGIRVVGEMTPGAAAAKAAVPPAGPIPAAATAPAGAASVAPAIAPGPAAPQTAAAPVPVSAAMKPL